MIKGADLEMKRLSCIKPSRPNLITHILKIRELFPTSVTEKDVKTEGSEIRNAAGFEGGGRDYGPRNAGGPPGAGEGKGTNSSLEPPERGPDVTLILAL